LTPAAARAGGALLAVLVAAVATAPADAARPGDRLYIVLFDHDQNKFSTALRTGADFLAGGEGRSFQIMLDGYGILSAVQGVTMTQREYVEVKRKHPDLAVIVCKESADSLARANKGKRVPYLPGIRIAPCNGLRDRLDKEGWRPALGF
jgi:hypothetical protein